MYAKFINKPGNPLQKYRRHSHISPIGRYRSFQAGHKSFPDVCFGSICSKLRVRGRRFQLQELVYQPFFLVCFFSLIILIIFFRKYCKYFELKISKNPRVIDFYIFLPSTSTLVGRKTATSAIDSLWTPRYETRSRSQTMFSYQLVRMDSGRWRHGKF